MFEQILVGVDGLAGGRDAISLAREFASSTSTITLAHTFPGHPYAWQGGNAAFWPMEEDEALALLETARQEAGLEAELRYTPVTPVGRGLHELADEIGADLLVVGSSRRGLFGRVLLGNDTRAALNGSPCAVAVAPGGYAEEPHVKLEIGVAYNGSPESAYALSVARRLAAGWGTHLSAFEVVSFPARVFMGSGIPTPMSAEELVKEARQRIATLGGVEPHAAYGDPVEELALYSASLDLLVVGSRGYGPLGRVVHGSTSQELARHARSPLLVLTRSAPVRLGPPSAPQEIARSA